jgi:hypothetical protein
LQSNQISRGVTCNILNFLIDAQDFGFGVGDNNCVLAVKCDRRDAQLFNILIVFGEIPYKTIEKIITEALENNNSNFHWHPRAVCAHRIDLEAAVVLLAHPSLQKLSH